MNLTDGCDTSIAATRDNRHPALEFAHTAGVGPKSDETVPRALRRHFAEPANPPMQIDFPYHPTLSEIAQHQMEIEKWEALRPGGYRFAKPGTIIGFLIWAVIAFLAATPLRTNWPWNVPLAILAIFTTVATVVCGLLWFDTPDIGPRPESSTIVPFARAENLHLMRGQAVVPRDLRLSRLCRSIHPSDPQAGR